MKKTIVLVMILVLVLGATSGVITYYSTRPHTVSASRTHLQRFASADDFIKAFKNGQKSQYGGAEDGIALKSAVPAQAPAAGTAEAGAPQHSNTNVQVEGVDEADIVKNDGNYIYAISGNNVFITAAYPAQEARVVSRIDFDKGAVPNEMFIRGDRLVVIGANGYDYAPGPLKEDVPPRRTNTTFIKVFDVSNREKPVLARTVEYEGTYSTARMIEGNVHVVLTTYPYYILYQKKGVKPDDVIPAFSDERGGAQAGAQAAHFAPACGYRQIEVVDPERFTSFLSIVSFSLETGDKTLNKKVIAGYSDAVYASTGNLYVTSADYQYSGWGPAGGGEQAKTTVYKFAFDGPRATYVVSGQVPGTILNQFSMDESGGFFRIATTRGHVNREGSGSTNNVYVLDPAMKMAGRLEGLAPGERIYSVRFMGARAYLVTFKKVDPLFVLDLADPGAPRVLGELKIPGYSDYLHPYDETHVIGVGKNTVEAQPEKGGNFAWYQGMKLAIFDVSDVANPREMHKVEIGDRGTDSYALSDHKAFLFDRSKNLLVLPVLLAELTPEQKASPGARANEYGTYAFQGAYVYDVSLEGGFQLKGRVTHADAGAGGANGPERGYGYYGSPDSVRRALYIGDSLYTVSEARIKVNRLDDLGEVATVQLI